MATVTQYAGTVANDATVGTADWANPTNAQGNQTSIYAAGSPVSGSAWRNDNDPKIVKAGTPSGTAVTGTGNWRTSAGEDSFGSSSDLWGLTWTAGDINDSGFGFAISPTRSGGGSPKMRYLKATNFGFNLPPTSVINGITVGVYRFDDNSGSGEARVFYFKITVDYTVLPSGGTLTMMGV